MKSFISKYIIVSFLLGVVGYATTITQTFNSGASSLTDNFTQSNPATGSFTWSSTAGIGNTGKIAISSGADQIWTTKQKYSMETDGVYNVKAMFKTVGTGYGSLGLTTSETSNNTGPSGTPYESSLGVVFHGGAGAWINKETASSTYVNTTTSSTSASTLDWANNADLGTGGSWYLFDLTVTRVGSTNQFNLSLTIYTVNSSTGAITGTFSGRSYTTTVTNTAIANASDLYIFFGSEGTRMDSIDNFEIETSNNVTITGEQAGGNAKYALDFDGTSYVTTGSDYTIGDFDGAKSHTLEAWFKLDTLNQDQTIIAKWNETDTNSQQYVLRVGSANVIRYYSETTGDEALDGTTTLEKNKWYHVALVRDGAYVRIYLDGKLENEANYGLTSQTRDGNLPLTIGAALNGSSVYLPFRGQIDEVRIWDDARSVTEITDNMNKELVGNETNLQAYYNFNEGAGNLAADSQINGTKYYGTLVNSPTWIALGENRLSFDGSNDYVDLGDTPDTSKAMSISAWIYSTGNATNQVIATKQYVFEFGKNTANKILMYFGNGTSYGSGSATSTDAIPNDTWTHIVTTRDNNGNIKIYINGVENGTGTDTDAGNNNTHTLISKYYNTSSGYFDGEIAEVSIFNRDLSSTEITNLANGQKLRGNEDGLIGYWPLDESISDIAVDKSAFSNNGTLYGPTWVADDLNISTIYTNEKAKNIFDIDSAKNIWGTSYAITNGSDSAKFDINSTTGELVFSDVSNATANSNYAVQITTASAGGTFVKDYAVKVKDTLINKAPSFTTDANISTPENNTTVGTTIEASDENITNNAISFNGSSDYILVSNSAAQFDNLEPYTVEGWFKLNQLSDGALVSKFTSGNQKSQWFMSISNNHIKHARNSSTYTGLEGNTTLEANTWYHLATIFDGTKLKVYVNGQLDGETAGYTFNTSSGYHDGDLPLSIGSFSDGSAKFNGKINEVRIWNKALTPSEINATMNTELNGNEDGLEAYYKFNETIGTDIADSSFNGYNGKLYGTTLPTASTTQIMDNSNLVYALGSDYNGTLFDINSSTGVLSFKSNPDYETLPNSYEVNVSVSDGIFTTYKLYDINVTDMTENIPIVQSTPVTFVKQNGSYSYKLVASDSDGDILNWSTAIGTSLPSWLSIQDSMVVTTFVDSGLSDPYGFDIDSNNNIILADSTSGTIKKITPEGDISTIYDFGTGSTQNPKDVTIGPDGNYYVAEYSRDRITKIDSTSLEGTEYASVCNVDGPNSVAFDADGNLIIVDRGNDDIKKYIPSTNSCGNIYTSTSDDPTGVTIDSSGNIFITLKATDEVKKLVHTSGDFTYSATVFADASDGISTPYDTYVDNFGNVFVVNTFQHDITKITPEGVASKLTGVTGVEGLVNDGENSKFDGPVGIATDSNGYVYVSDIYNNVIRKIEFGTRLVGTAPASGGSYDVNLTVTDGTTIVAHNFTVEVNHSPTITSLDGNVTASVDVYENNPFVYDYNASDVDNDSMTWSISGTDSSLFDINSSTGKLTFKVAPDFDNPSDNGSDNNYNVTVTVTDENDGVSSQDLTIVIKNQLDEENEKALVYYNFDDNVQDQTGNGNHGILIHGTYVNGKDNKALSLAGNGYVKMPDNLILNNQNFTISIDFNATTGQSGSLVGYQNTVATSYNSATNFIPIIGIDSNGILKAEVWKTSNGGMVVSSTSRVDDGVWHRVILTGDTTNNKLTVYLDGVKIGEQSDSIAHLDMAYNQIGLAYSSSRGINDYFTGLIDEFKFYRKALSAEEISKESQVINFADIATQDINIVSNVTLEVNATSGLEVTLISETPSVCSVAEKIVTFITTGDCNITANQYGDRTYGAAVSITKSFIIKQNTAPNITKKNAIQLDLTTDYGYTNTLNLETKSITIEFWLKMLQLNDAQNFMKVVPADEPTTSTMAGQKSIIPTIDISNNIGMFVSNGSSGGNIYTTTKITDNEWHHVSFTYKGSNDTMSIYVDGVPTDKINYTTGTPLDFSTEPMRMVLGGNDFISTTLNAVASFDEIRIWDRDFTQSEVQNNMNRDLSGDEEKLVAFYRADETSGTILKDSAGGDNNLTLVNTTDADWIEGIAKSYINVSENTKAVTQLSATDEQNDTLTWSISGADATLFDINSSTGVITFKVAPDYETPNDLNGDNDYEITVSVSDGYLSDTQNLVVSVIDIGETPVIDTLSNLNLTEDNGVLYVGTNASVSNGSQITYSVSSSNTSIATVSVNTDGNITVTPIADANGVVTIEVNATANGLTATQTFDLNISSVDDAPVLDTITNPSAKNEDFSEFNISLSASDVENDSVTFSATSNNTNVATVLVVNNDTLVVSAVANAYGEANITVKVTQDTNSSLYDEQNITFSVNSVNDAPTITAINDQNKSEDFADFNVSFTIADIDRDDLNITITNDATNLVTTTLNGDSNLTYTSYNGADINLTITSIANRFGSANISATVKDGNNSLATSSFKVVVPAVIDFPDINSSAITLDEDFGDFNITLTSIDFAGGSSADINLSINNNVVTLPNDGNTTDLNYTITLSSIANLSGDANLTISIQANEQETNATLSVYVTPVNDAPTISGTPIDGSENSAYSWTPTFGDIDNNITTELSFVAHILPTWASLNSTTGEISGTPTFDDSGFNEFNISVNDGQLSAYLSGDINISNTDRAPIIPQKIVPSVDEDTPMFMVDMNISDPDGDSITVEAVSSNTTIATVNVNSNNLLEITPQANQYGTITIELNATSNGLVTPGEVNITIDSVNDKPSLASVDDVNLSEDFGTYNIELNGTDIDGDSLTYSAVSSREDIVTVNVIGNTLTLSSVKNAYGNSRITAYTYDSEYNSSISFIVRVSDVIDTNVTTNEDGSQTFKNTSENNNSVDVNITKEGMETTIEHDGTVRSESNTTNPKITVIVTPEGDTNTTINGEKDSTVNIGDLNKTITINENNETITSLDDFNTTITQNPDGTVEINKTTPSQKDISSELDSTIVDIDDNGTTTIKGIVGENNSSVVLNPNGEVNSTISTPNGSVELNINKDINSSTTISENGDITTTLDNNTTIKQTGTPSIEINATTQSGNSIDMNLEGNTTTTVDENGNIIVETKDSNITLSPNGDLNITTNGGGTISIPDGTGDVTIETDENGETKITIKKESGSVTEYIIHADGTVTENTYDKNGNLTDSVTHDPGEGSTAEAEQTAIIENPDGSTTLENTTPNNNSVDVNITKDDMNTTTQPDGTVISESNSTTPKIKIIVTPEGDTNSTVSNGDKNSSVNVGDLNKTITVNEDNETVTSLDDFNTTIIQKADGSVDVNKTTPSKKDISSDLNSTTVNVDENGTTTIKGNVGENNSSVVLNPNGEVNSTITSPNGETKLNINGEINATTTIGENGDITTTLDNNTTIKQTGIPSIEINATNTNGSTIDVNLEGNTTTTVENNGDITISNKDGNITLGSNGDLNISINGGGTIDIKNSESNVTVQTDANGNTQTIITNKDGSVDIITINDDGTISIVKKDIDGNIIYSKTYPANSNVSVDENGVITVVYVEDGVTLKDTIAKDGSVMNSNNNVNSQTSVDSNGTITTTFPDTNTTVVKNSDGSVDVNKTTPSKKDISSDLNSTTVNVDENGTTTIKGNVGENNSSVVLNPNGEVNSTITSPNGETKLNINGEINATTTIGENGDITTTLDNNTTIKQTGIPSIEINTTSDSGDAINLNIEGNTTTSVDKNGNIIINNDDKGEEITIKANGKIEVVTDNKGSITVPNGSGDTNITTDSFGNTVLENTNPNGLTTKITINANGTFSVIIKDADGNVIENATYPANSDITLDNPIVIYYQDGHGDWITKTIESDGTITTLNGDGSSTISQKKVNGNGDVTTELTIPSQIYAEVTNHGNNSTTIAIDEGDYNYDIGISNKGSLDINTQNADGNNSHNITVANPGADINISSEGNMTITTPEFTNADGSTCGYSLDIAYDGSDMITKHYLDKRLSSEVITTIIMRIPNSNVDVTSDNKVVHTGNFVNNNSIDVNVSATVNCAGEVSTITKLSDRNASLIALNKAGSTVIIDTDGAIDAELPITNVGSDDVKQLKFSVDPNSGDITTQKVYTDNNYSEVVYPVGAKVIAKNTNIAEVVVDLTNAHIVRVDVKDENNNTVTTTTTIDNSFTVNRTSEGEDGKITSEINTTSGAKIVIDNFVDGKAKHLVEVNGIATEATSDIEGADVNVSTNGVTTTFEDTTTNIKAEVKATLDGKAEHKLDIKDENNNTVTTKATSAIIGAKTIIDKDISGKAKVVTKVSTTNTNAQAVDIEVDAQSDGQAVHKVKVNGVETKATSAIKGAQTSIKTTGEVETNATIDANTSAIVLALADGSAKHEVKGIDFDTIVTSNIAGANTLIESDGTVSTDVNDTVNNESIQAIVVTNSDGTSSTKFVKGSEALPTLPSGSFPKDNNITINKTNGDLMEIKTTITLDESIRF